MSKKDNVFEREIDVSDRFKIRITIEVIPTKEKEKEKQEIPQDTQTPIIVMNELPSIGKFADLIVNKIGLKTDVDFTIEDIGDRYKIILKKYWGRDKFSKFMDIFAEFNPEYSREDGNYIITVNKSP